jgi:hypothetical protein
MALVLDIHQILICHEATHSPRLFSTLARMRRTGVDLRQKA